MTCLKSKASSLTICSRGYLSDISVSRSISVTDA